MDISSFLSFGIGNHDKMLQLNENTSIIFNQNDTVINSVDGVHQVIRSNSKILLLQELQSDYGISQAPMPVKSLIKTNSFTYINNINLFENNNNLGDYQNNDNGINELIPTQNVCITETGPLEAGKEISVITFKQDLNVSDASTVEGSIEDDAEDGAANGSEEPFTYLQGLNSDNLMNFSQQSALQELMLNERTDIKPKIDTLPSLIDHDYGGYNFEMMLIQPNKSPWMHSQLLNKIYIRMNQTFNIDVVFRPKMPIQQMRLRAFLCFVKEVSEPVLRCQNHQAKDSSKNPLERQNLLRCDNPATEYCGNQTGKSIVDRMSLLVPLTMTATKNDTVVRQTTAFKFTCQNSCFGRKETSLVFCLENTEGEILGQRVLDVKICSCPKRDKISDERHLPGVENNKRKHEDDTNKNKNCKQRKLMNPLPFLIKDDSNQSETADQSDSSEEEEFGVGRTEKARYRLTFTCNDKEHLLQLLDGMHDKAGGAILRDPKRANLHYYYAQKITTLKRRARKLP